MAAWDTDPVVEDQPAPQATQQPWERDPVVESSTAPSTPTEAPKPSLLQTLFGGARLATGSEYLKSVEPIPEQAAPVVANAVQAVGDIAKGIPGFVAQLPEIAYQGAKFATGGSEERVQVAQEALRQAIPQGQQIAKDIQAPLGTRESFRGIANIGMLALPAIGELSGVLWPKATEAPPVQTEAPPIQTEPLIETATAKSEQLAKSGYDTSSGLSTQEAVQNARQTLSEEQIKSQADQWLIDRGMNPETADPVFKAMAIESTARGEVAQQKYNQLLKKLKTEEIPNAVQEPIATQPDGVRAEPQMPQETQAPAASVGGERVPEIGQGTEVPGSAQEVAQPAEMRSGPASADPIKTAAIEMQDGEVFEGKTHAESYQNALDAGYSNADIEKATKGFTDVGDEFLNSKDALERARRVKQIGARYNAEVRARGQTEDFGQLHAEAFNKAQDTGTQPVSEAAPRTETPGVAEQPAIEIPKDANVKVQFKTETGEPVTRQMNAREAEGIFTKERSSLKALIDCLGR